MYNLFKIHPLYTYFVCPIFCILTIVLGAFFLWYSVTEQEAEPFAYFLGLLPFWYILFITSYKVKIENNKISFFTIFKKKDINPEEILIIEDGMFFLRIKCRNGEVSVSTLMDNITQFKNILKKLNPNIIFKKYKKKGIEL